MERKRLRTAVCGVVMVALPWLNAVLANVNAGRSWGCELWAEAQLELFCCRSGNATFLRLVEPRAMDAGACGDDGLVSQPALVSFFLSYKDRERERARARCQSRNPCTHRLAEAAPSTPNEDMLSWDPVAHFSFLLSLPHDFLPAFVTRRLSGWYSLSCRR